MRHFLADALLLSQVLLYICWWRCDILGMLFLPEMVKPAVARLVAAMAMMAPHQRGSYVWVGEMIWLAEMFGFVPGFV